MERPFVIYRKPEEATLHAWFQHNTKPYVYNFSGEAGFVIAPFDSDKSNYFIPQSNATLFEAKINDKLKPDPQLFDCDTSYTNEPDHKAHLDFVKKTVEAIRSGEMIKVVISRKEVMSCNFTFDDSFTRMMELYPTAFCYFWYHPHTGCWTGATPEILFRLKNGNYTTIALAGTKKVLDGVSIDWGVKEKREQKLVTDAIIEVIKKYTPNIKLDGPYTSNAGKVAHLRTKISGTITKNFVDKLIQDLHPTPAVCGTPRQKAKSYILENEGYDREFYTGYLGPINIRGEDNESVVTDLYVNLRCIKLEADNTTIYVGGGITADSIPEDEWEETVSKSITMKRVMLNKPK